MANSPTYKLSAKCRQLTGLIKLVFFVALSSSITGLGLRINSASAQQEPSLPLTVNWAAPDTNEDGSCLTGNTSSCSNDLANYRIYRSSSAPGATPPTPTLVATITASLTSFTDQQLTAGLKYNYIVTAVDTHGNESVKGTLIGALALTPTGDADSDNIVNGVDNCPLSYNADQADQNNDGIGDACTDGGSGNGECLLNSDADTICDTQDNCPGVANQDQLDSNGDGIGDACSRSTAQVRCSRDGNNTTSSIAVTGDAKAMLLDPNTLEVGETDIALNGQCFVGDVNSQTSGPNGMGALEFIETSPGLSSELTWEINSAERIDALDFGLKGDKVFGCYVDGDNELDLVAFNKKEIKIKLSFSSEEKILPIKSLGKIFDVNCGDTNGDGLDEFAVLHLPSKVKGGKKPVRSVSILSSLSGKVLKSTASDSSASKVIIADTKGNGRGSACTLSKINSKLSAISCSKNGKAKIIVPASTEFASGSFTSGSRKESFLTIGKGGSVNLINTKGKVRTITAATMGSSAKKLHLVPCR